MFSRWYEIAPGVDFRGAICVSAAGLGLFLVGAQKTAICGSSVEAGRANAVQQRPRHVGTKQPARSNRPDASKRHWLSNTVPLLTLRANIRTEYRPRLDFGPGGWIRPVRLWHRGGDLPESIGKIGIVPRGTLVAEMNRRIA